MSGVAEHVGRETAVGALGRSFRVGRWTRAIWAEFLAWAKPRIPDPLEVVARHLDKYPPALQEALVRHACDRACDYLGVGSPAVQQCLASLEGSVYLLYLLLKANHPEMTEDMALEIALEVGADRLKATFDAAAGKAPPEGNGHPAPAGR